MSLGNGWFGRPFSHQILLKLSVSGNGNMVTDEMKYLKCNLICSHMLEQNIGCYSALWTNEASLVKGFGILFKFLFDRIQNYLYCEKKCLQVYTQ